MPRPTTKEALLQLANDNFEKLWQLIDSMPEQALTREFDFTDKLKHKEVHWQRDKNLRDVLIHLFEWHRLHVKSVK